MGGPLVVHIDNPRPGLGRALAAAEQALGSEVELDNDYYWHLPVEAAFDMTHEPSALTVGQLRDDVASSAKQARSPSLPGMTSGISWA